MKLVGVIKAVSERGEQLTVEVKAAQVGATDWLFGELPVSFVTRSDDRSRRTFYVGREVTITVEPRRG